jgi:hypothetical protein
MHSARRNKAHAEVIRYLLKMGWDCDIQAFNNAIDSGSIEVVQMLIGRDPFLIAYVGSHNKTCLDVALNGYMPRSRCCDCCWPTAPTLTS